MSESVDQDKPLKTLIESSGYTQKDFATQLGLAYSAVKYYVAGQRRPSVDVFADMCRTLKQPPKVVLKALDIDVTGIPDDDN